MSRHRSRRLLRLALAIIVSASLSPGVASAVTAYSLGGYPSTNITVVGVRGVSAGGRTLVALTFDDGPSPYTGPILDILRDRGVRATFFTVGSINTYPGAARRIVAEGHQIANHSLQHKNLTRCDAGTIRYQVVTQQAAIEAITGVRTGVFRAPGGNFTAREWNAAAGAITMHVGWDVDPRDWARPGSSTIVSRAVSGGRAGGIVLLHDGGGDRSQTVAALPSIIDRLRASGCEFVTIDELRSHALGGAPFVPTTNAVYRFYNRANGSHFYTASDPEARSVVDENFIVYRYEGVAYVADPAKNDRPLYRFYNRVNGSHFYTASPEERDSVMARLSGTYTYEGPSYNVLGDAVGGSIPVYRFYNVRNGTHFYTASAEERDSVMARLAGVYKYEGLAFWLGQ